MKQILGTIIGAVTAPAKIESYESGPNKLRLLVATLVNLILMFVVISAWQVGPHTIWLSMVFSLAAYWNAAPYDRMILVRRVTFVTVTIILYVIAIFAVRMAG